MSAKEDYLDLMSERRACGRSRLDFVIEAYVTELEQRVEELAKIKDIKLNYGVGCSMLSQESEALRRFAEENFNLRKELDKLKARIESSPKVFTSWDGGIIVDAAPRAELLHEGEETREVYAVPVLEEEKEEHEKLG